MFPGLLLLEACKIIKSRKTEFLVIGEAEIMLSELSQGEYVNLNRFLKENFGIFIKDVKRVDINGDINDQKGSSKNLWSWNLNFSQNLQIFSSQEATRLSNPANSEAVYKIKYCLNFLDCHATATQRLTMTKIGGKDTRHTKLLFVHLDILFKR